jgi:CheY-like chemotaxis protein
VEEQVTYIIDDDKANNFLTRIMLEDVGLTNFRQFKLVDEAMDELRRVISEKLENEYPGLILLDLNMPIKTGWDFLEEFRALPEEVKSKARIYLLTSSDFRGDHEKAKAYPEVLDFIDKPVTDEVAKWLKEKYFSPSFE